METRRGWCRTLAPWTTVAVVVALVLPSMRVFFVLVVNDYGGRVGLVNAAPVVVGVFVAPLLLVLLAPVARGPRLVDAAVLGLVAARVGVQVLTSSGPRLVVSAAATIVGLVALPLVLAHLRADASGDGARAAYRFTTGVLWGLVADLVLHGAFLTWDVAWRSGAVATLVVVGECVAAVGVWWMGRAPLRSDAREPALGAGIGTATVGPFLAAHLLMLHNIGFAAGDHLSIPSATALVAAGDVAALVAVRFVASRPPSRPAAAAWLVATVAVAVVVPPGTSAVAMVAFVAAHATTAAALHVGVAGHGAGAAHAGVWRTGLTVGVGGLLLVGPPIGYFYGQRESLPVAPTVLLAVALALSALAFVPSLLGRPALPVALGAPRRVAAVLCLVPVVVGTVSFASGHAVSPRTSIDATFRLVDFNVSYGVGRDGQVDPEAIARVIEAQHPDVVTLQEVTRGWLIAGGVELYEWLGHRLGYPYSAFAPAADRQFGNAILSRFPIVEVATAPLPTGQAAQRRSYLRVVVDLGPERLTVYDVHLSAWSDAPTRLRQVETILAAWGSAPRTIVAGDMNASPGGVDMARLVAAGFHSAQDQAGDPTAPTSTDPDERIDWVFGTADLEFVDFGTVASSASDHLALVTTVVLR